MAIKAEAKGRGGIANSRSRQRRDAMSDRPDYITCIRCGKGRAWCWRDVSTLFHFETIEHAAQSQLNGDRLRVCPECREAVIKALNSQEETPC